jgi:predicted metal-binding protein
LFETEMPGGVPWQLGGRPARRRARRKHAHPEDLRSPSGGVELSEDCRPQLFICVSCHDRGAALPPEGEPTDGKRLYDAARALEAAMGAPAPVHVVPTLCFANCERGCSAGISAPGKWSYILGELRPEDAADLMLYGEAYAKAKTGVVLPSGRPASLQRSVMARFPSHLEPIKDAAE